MNMTPEQFNQLISVLQKSNEVSVWMILSAISTTLAVVVALYFSVKQALSQTALSALKYVSVRWDCMEDDKPFLELTVRSKHERLIEIKDGTLLFGNYPTGGVLCVMPTKREVIEPYHEYTVNLYFSYFHETLTVKELYSDCLSKMSSIEDVKCAELKLFSSLGTHTFKLKRDDFDDLKLCFVRARDEGRRKFK